MPDPIHTLICKRVGRRAALSARVQFMGPILRPMRRERGIFLAWAILMKRNAIATAELEGEGMTPLPRSQDDPWSMNSGELIRRGWGGKFSKIVQ